MHQQCLQGFDMFGTWRDEPHGTEDLKQSLVLGWLLDEWFQVHYCITDTLLALHVLRDHYWIFMRPLWSSRRQGSIDIGKCFFALRSQNHFSLFSAQADSKLLSTHHVVFGSFGACLIDSCQELIHAAAGKLCLLFIGELARLTTTWYLFSLRFRHSLIFCFTNCLCHVNNICLTLFCFSIINY